MVDSISGETQWYPSRKNVKHNIQKNAIARYGVGRLFLK